jgi:hypothetical protein
MDGIIPSNPARVPRESPGESGIMEIRLSGKYAVMRVKNFTTLWNRQRARGSPRDYETHMHKPFADAHRDDGKRFVARADEKLTAFVELESAIWGCRIGLTSRQDFFKTDLCPKNITETNQVRELRSEGGDPRWQEEQAKNACPAAGITARHIRPAL